MADKTYIKWNCKEVQFNNWWSIINISFKLEDLSDLANEKGYINLVLNKRKEVWQYWDTHYLTLNDYKPDQNKTETKPKVNEFWDKELSIEDIPF